MCICINRLPVVNARGLSHINADITNNFLCKIPNIHYPERTQIYEHWVNLCFQLNRSLSVSFKNCHVGTNCSSAEVCILQEFSKFKASRNLSLPGVLDFCESVNT